MKKITLYAVSHKEIENILKERTMIGVGNNKDIPGISIYDNTGDNISDKNTSYCELTALYWIWKNDVSEIVGLEHYRRQFLDRKKLLSKDSINRILNKNDLIIPRCISCTTSIYNRYVEVHGEADLIELRSVIRELYPEYLEDFDYLKRTNKIHVCNMVIGKKEIINNYCIWLFNILFALEPRIDLSERDGYQKRVFGFLAERLFNVYLHHNKDIKTKSIRISNPSEKYDSQVFPLPWDLLYYTKRLINYKHIFR